MEIVKRPTRVRRRKEMEGEKGRRDGKIGEKENKITN